MVSAVAKAHWPNVLCSFAPWALEMRTQHVAFAVTVPDIHEKKGAKNTRPVSGCEERPSATCPAKAARMSLGIPLLWFHRSALGPLRLGISVSDEILWSVVQWIARQKYLHRAYMKANKIPILSVAAFLSRPPPEPHSPNAKNLNSVFGLTWCAKSQHTSLLLQD